MSNCLSSFLVDEVGYDLHESFSDDDEDLSPLILACKMLADIKIIQFLVENGLRGDSKSNNNSLPLHTLIQTCSLKERDKACSIASYLIENGADVWAVNTEEKSALCLAAEKGLIRLTLLDRHMRDGYLDLRQEQEDWDAWDVAWGDSNSSSYES